MQGPFTLDRIQGLLRRGRFSRHFHVSEDKKEWYPAEEFPELFRGVSRGSRSASHNDDDDDDDDAFNGGGSPFDGDDDDMEPTRTSRGKRGGGRRSKRRDEEFEDDDEVEDDDIDEDEEDDEDEDWEDDDEGGGALTGLYDWMEANVKGVVALLVLLLLGGGWFAFGRESFTQDAADLQQLIEIKTKISTANTMGATGADWNSMVQATNNDLSSMVSRLNDTASAKDHVKQELLFASRDDIPKMFKELPNGVTDAEARIMGRFARIEEMIKTQTRQNSGSVLTQAPPAPTRQVQSPAGNTGSPMPDNSQQAEMRGNQGQNQEPQPAGQSKEPGGPGQSTMQQPNNQVPANGIPGQSGGFASPNQPQGFNQPNQRSQPAPQSGQPSNVPANNTGGVPGRPGSAKF